MVRRPYHRTLRPVASFVVSEAPPPPQVAPGLDLDELERRKQQAWVQSLLNSNSWQSEALKTPLAEIGLSVRVVNALEAAGLQSVLDLLVCYRDELLQVNSIGEKTLKELFQRLEHLGFYLAGRQPPASHVDLVARRRQKFREQYGIEE